MIASILPGAEPLAQALDGKVDYIFVDRMNYSYANRFNRKYGLRDGLFDHFFHTASRQIADACKKSGIGCRLAL